MSSEPRDPNSKTKPKPSSTVTRPFSLDPSDPHPVPMEDEFDFDLSQEWDSKSGAQATVDFGGYLILGRIGAGGMGQVFRARHRTMDREVAIKILPQRLSRDPAAVERFYAEVRAQAKLMHPNIVTAFDAGCHEVRDHRVYFLVMELVHGESIAHRIATSGAMSPPQVLKILQQAALALEYAHSLGVVHRDIKPGNMMLTQDGVLKILDFGLAVLRNLQEESKDSTQHHLVGTVEFMSPEQINTPQLVDHRSDLYSLGATLYYMLTGRPMFSGEAIQTALAQIHRRPTALYEVRGDIDLRFDSVFQSLVAKDVRDRCQSAHDLLEKLHALHLVPRPGGPSPLRSTSSSLPKLNFDNPTSLPFGTSTSARTFEPVGIELGMFHSRVSYINSELKVEEVPIDGDSYQLRNMLYSDAESVAIGSAAVAQRVQRPNQIFYGLQRWYGLPSLERPFGGRRVPPKSSSPA
jgi:eukaryotic-like serine/threonine-protein kinase